MSNCETIGAGDVKNVLQRHRIIALGSMGTVDPAAMTDSNN